MKQIAKLLLVGLTLLASAAMAQINQVPRPGITDSAGALHVNTEGAKASYSANLLNNTPAATPTDMAILTGATGKIVKVTRVRLTVAATASGQVDFQLIKRSAGTQSAVNTAFSTTNSVPMNSNDPASAVIAAGIAGVYTANPASRGTAVGNIDGWTQTILANTTVEFRYDCGDRPAKCITLLSPTEILAVAGNGDTLLTGEKFGITFEWTEQ